MDTQISYLKKTSPLSQIQFMVTTPTTYEVGVFRFMCHRFKLSTIDSILTIQ